MLLRKRVNELEQDFEDRNDAVDKSFVLVGEDMDNVMGRLDAWALRHQNLDKNLANLTDEIASNGVIRDIRNLQKELQELKVHTAALIMEHDRQLNTISTNGVATSINKLNREVFQDKKDSPNEENGFMGLMRMMSGSNTGPDLEATLAGKVDAIIEHLGITVEVKPQETTEAKVVAKKAKKGTK